MSIRDNAEYLRALSNPEGINQYTKNGGSLAHAGKPLVIERERDSDRVKRLSIQDAVHKHVSHDYEKRGSDWHHVGSSVSMGRGKKSQYHAGSGKVGGRLHEQFEKFGGPRPEMPSGVGKTGSKAFEGPLGDAMYNGKALKDL